LTSSFNSHLLVRRPGSTVVFIVSARNRLPFFSSFWIKFNQNINYYRLFVSNLVIAIGCTPPLLPRQLCLLTHPMQRVNLRNWCFTLNNPPEDFSLDAKCKDFKVRYCIVQLERGDSGTLHLQGYVEFLVTNASDYGNYATPAVYDYTITTDFIG